MLIKKGSTKGKLRKVVLELQPNTTPTTTEQPNSITDCELGYSAVCTQSIVEHPNQFEIKSVCPASHNATYKVDTGEVCSCLPTRVVEQDVAEGMSPLGSQYQGCVKIPAHLLPGDVLGEYFYLSSNFSKLSQIFLDVGNVTAMMEMWDIESTVKEITKDATKQEELMSALKKAMEKEMKHSKVLQENKSTKFMRSTTTSRKISENYRMMKCLQNATKSVTGNWASSRQSSGQLFQATCIALTSSLSRCPVECDGTDPYRAIDGCCNNLNTKDTGSTHTAFARFLDPAYEDSVEVPRGGLSPSSLPNARAVSREVHRTEQIVGNKDASLMVMQFGQFLDHDITLTPEPDSECCNDSLELDVCFNIDSTMDKFFMGLTDCLPFSRSDAICGQTGRREQINGISAYIDGSNIYGSARDTSEGLRTKDGGELRVNEIGPTMPTRKDAGFESGPGQNPKDLFGGDIRAIEQPGLASMHSLFLNEHNRISRILKGKNEDLVDEELYQITRKIVGAELQNIVFSEFLPVVLGEEAMVKFNLKLPEIESRESVYDPSVVPDIRNEFATAAFRFGHFLIPNQILPALSPIRTQSLSCPMKDNFFQFEQFILGSDLSGKAWQNMIRGIIDQDSPSMDTSVDKSVLDFLFCGSNCRIPDGFGQDLAARNIQRGRDHGLQPYTKYREFCGLTPLTANKPVEISQQDWDNIQRVYSSVEDIDLFVGGLAEVGSGDGLVGPTFGCIIAKQFELLMKGDRFFFTHTSSGNLNEKGLPVNTKISIRKRSLGDIICDNTDTSGTARNVMKITSDNNVLVSCSAREGLDFDSIIAELNPTAVVGILTSGGSSDGVDQNDLELFIPSTRTSRTCSLMSLPSPRARHTLDIIQRKPVICAGNAGFKASCTIFRGGNWSDYFSPLKHGRDEPTSWVSSNGLVIMGGWSSSTTTEILPGDDFSREGFKLKHPTKAACSITGVASTVITGGHDTGKLVTRYNLEQGFVEDLPELKQARERHGCGSYRMGNGALVLKVAGGYGPPAPFDPVDSTHDSTEKL